MLDTNDELGNAVIARNVSMYLEQWQVVDEINKRFDYRSASQALRHIVNEFSRLKVIEAAMRQADVPR